MLRTLFTIIVLCCCSLIGAQTNPNNPWQEIDTLLAHGHYATAYEKARQQYETSKRKGSSHDMLKAVYKQQMAAAAYQENHIEHGIGAYKALIPHLQGADKSMAHLLLAALVEDKRSHYEAALAEREALKAIRTEDYDLLVEGDTLGLRLRPTLYDVVMHAIIPSNIYLNDAKIKNLLHDQRDLLYGTAEEFVSLCLPSDTLSYELWQLGKLQELTRHHRNTADAAVRAHVDHRRIEALGYIQHYSNADVLQEAYIEGLERIAESYRGNATEQVMFLFKLADYHKPTIYEHSDEEAIGRELKRAARMERYVERIREVAPDSEWAKAAEALYRQVTHPYLKLQGHKTLLPGREGSITITLRGAGSIAYRIVPRHAGETTDNFNFKEVIGRKSVGKAYEIVHPEYPNPYV